MCAATSESRDAVRARLDRVYDPELDRSVVELDYVDEIRVDGGRVTVTYTLPTAWCSPAFAWMMATDARDEIEALPWVDRAAVYLRDHMHAEELNRGVNGGLSFGETFPDADGGVSEVRATLDAKARLARQYDAVETLLDAGVDPEQVGALRRRDLEFVGDRVAVSLREGALSVTVPAEPIERYLEKAHTTGLVTAADDHLFRTPEGEPIPTESFELVQRRARLATVNMDGQGGVCAALNEARQARGDGP
jgi:metal-sulfur cluster biosynthetic enzyme